jgi:hypothetical protein
MNKNLELWMLSLVFVCVYVDKLGEKAISAQTPILQLYPHALAQFTNQGAMGRNAC